MHHSRSGGAATRQTRPARWWALAALWLASCGGDAAPADGGAAAPPASPRVGVVFGEHFAGYESALYDAARSRGRELVVRSGYGHAAATELSVELLIEQRVAALVLFPSVPDLLQRARKLATDHSLPLLLALRSDGRSGPWAGVASDEQADTLGARLAERLAADGIAEPTVVTFEDARWPESRRRVEAILAVVEQRLGHVQVRLRQSEEGGIEPTLALAMPRLARIGRVDLLVAGDAASTACALAAAERAGLRATACIAGTSDDEALLAAAAGSSRTWLIGYTRAQVAEAVMDGLDALLAAPAEKSSTAPSAERWPVAATLHGPAPLSAQPAKTAGQ